MAGNGFLQYVTGFGKTCIVHTSNFYHLKSGRNITIYTDLKFARVIEEWLLYRLRKFQSSVTEFMNL